jgi:hypothetical protein
MAVTILTTPAAHTPAYNNQNIVASSTNSSQTNFKYVVTIQINDGTYDNNLSLKVPARPDNAKLYFNPQKFAEAYIKSDLNTTSTDFFVPNAAIPSAFKKVTIGIDEEYGSPVSGFGGASASYYIWNGAYDSLDFASYTYAVGTVAEDLTTSPSLTDRATTTQNILLKTWHRGFSSRDLRYLYIESFDSAGNSVQVVTFQNPYYTVSTFYSRNYVSLNISPEAINAFTGTITAKTNALLPNIPTTTSYYTMYFLDSTPLISSNTYTVYIDDFCSKYDLYTLHFLNYKGNYDSMNFNMKSISITEKETDSYKKIPYSLNNSNYYRYEKYTNDTVIYNTVLKNKMTLNSNWITDAQSEWLRDLIMSPDIKMETPTGDLIAVRCTVKSYETKKSVNDKMVMITIDVENSLQDVRQRA